MFDPLNLLLSIAIKSKLLIKTLWINKFEWDQPIPDDIIKIWSEIAKYYQQGQSLIDLF